MLPFLILLSYSSLLMLSLLDNIRAPFYPDILSELGLNATRGAMFYSMTSLFAFLSSWLSHRFVTRFSSVNLMRFSSVLVFSGFALISRSQEYTILLLSCAIFGTGYGGMNVVQNIMIVEASRHEMRRRLFSGLHAMYGFAALFAPLIASLVRWLGWNWRDGFFLLSILALVILAMGLAAKPAQRLRSEELEPHSVHMNKAEWRKCILVSVMMAGYLWGEIGASTRMVQWLRAEVGYSPDLANLHLAGFFVALLAGRIFFGLVHFPNLNNWKILKFSATLSALAFYLGLHVSPIWFTFCGLCMAPFFPVTMEQVTALFGSKSSHALGFVIGFGSLSVVVLHVVLGALTDAANVSYALEAGFLALVANSLGLWLRDFLSGKRRYANH